MTTGTSDLTTPGPGLQSIRVQRFKSIADTTVNLGRVTVLVGPNNAGKSSLLQAMQFAVSIVQSLALEGKTGWSKGERSGTLATEQLVYTPLRDVQALGFGGALKQVKDDAVHVTFSKDDEQCDVFVRRGKNKNLAVNVAGEVLGRSLESLEEPFSVVAPGLAGIPAFEEFKSTGIVRRAAARGDANSVFRNVLWRLKSDEVAWSEFCESFNEIFPDLSIEARFDPDVDEHLAVTIEKDGFRLPIDSAGTGVLQTIQVLSYIGVYRPQVLILDEPDSHLHPDNQRKLARLLYRLAESADFQILMSTHSRHFLDEFASLQATISWFAGGEVQEAAFDMVTALLDLGALDARDRLRSGATPLILITEDENTSEIESIVSSSGWVQGEFDVWSYRGASNIESARVLVQFIRDHASGTKIVVHRDRDYMFPDEVTEYEEVISALGATPFVTTGTDAESHFLDKDHLRAVHPVLNDSEAQAVIDAAIERSREASLEKMINSRTSHANRNREGGKQPNTGRIAAEAQRQFDEDPSRYVHGKTALKAARAILHERHKLDGALTVPSTAIEDSGLRAVVSAT